MLSKYIPCHPSFLSLVEMLWPCTAVVASHLRLQHSIWRHWNHFFSVRTSLHTAHIHPQGHQFCFIVCCTLDTCTHRGLNVKGLSSDWSLGENLGPVRALRASSSYHWVCPWGEQKVLASFVSFVPSFLPLSPLPFPFPSSSLPPPFLLPSLSFTLTVSHVFWEDLNSLYNSEWLWTPFWLSYPHFSSAGITFMPHCASFTQCRGWNLGSHEFSTNTLSPDPHLQPQMGLLLRPMDFCFIHYGTTLSERAYLKGIRQSVIE